MILSPYNLPRMQLGYRLLIIVRDVQGNFRKYYLNAFSCLLSTVSNFSDAVILWCDGSQYWAAFESLNAILNAGDFLSIWYIWFCNLNAWRRFNTISPIKKTLIYTVNNILSGVAGLKTGSLLVWRTPGACQWWCLAPVPSRLSNGGDMQPPPPKLHIS